MENILSMLYRGECSILETAYEKNAAHTLALGKADALEILCQGLSSIDAQRKSCYSL